MNGSPNDEPLELDDAKDALKSIVERVQRSQRKALVAALEEHFAAPAVTGGKAPPPDGDPFHVGRFALWILIVAALTAAAVVLARQFPPTVQLVRGADSDPRFLFTYLAFVVALASYLASVARELYKRLPEQRVKEKRTARNNLFLLSAAEAALVLAGVAAAWKLIASPAASAIVPPATDAFLLWMLATVLLYLAGLHTRIWLVYRPWKGVTER